MKLYNNGILIQDTMRSSAMMRVYNEINPIGLNKYNGVHKHIIAPFHCYNTDSSFDIINREIMFSKPDNDGLSQKYEFIHNSTLTRRYIALCHEHGIIMRYLFIQSEYNNEIWDSAVPDGEFLGYEVCEIPLDFYTYSDIFCNARYNNYIQILNKNGLFSSENDAADFKRKYERDLVAGIVGDGDVNLYVCKLYEVSEEELIKVL